VKVTKELVEQFNLHQAPWGEMDNTFLADALQAVLDLIDPVPADVDFITDVDGDGWERYGDTTWRLMWPSGSGDCESIMDVIEQYGPITWEGKP
jgi:hypothetical protein